MGPGGLGVAQQISDVPSEVTGDEWGCVASRGWLGHVKLEADDFTNTMSYPGTWCHVIWQNQTLYPSQCDPFSKHCSVSQCFKYSW